MNTASLHTVPGARLSMIFNSTASNRQAPSRWPFSANRPCPPANAPKQEQNAPACASRPLSQSVTANASMSRKRIVGDILLVAVWGAMIPGLMWLGAAAGF